MALPVNTNNSLVKKDGKQESFSTFLNGKIGKALVANAISEPSKQSRFMTALITLVAMNPDLAKCDYPTIVSAALQSESLGLPLNNQMGFSYVIPFNDNKKNRVVAQFQIGWKGLVQLMIRSGQMKKIHVIEVRQGELVKFNPILNDFEFSYLTDEEERAKAPVIGYYAMFETINGYVQELYWSHNKMEVHAKTYSQGYKKDLEKHTAYTFWAKSFDEMAKKTMLKQISKFAPMSVDSQLAQALQADQAVVTEDGGYEYVDGNDNDETVIDAEVKEVTPKEAPKGSKKVDGDGVVVDNQPAPQEGSTEDESGEGEGTPDLADELNN